MACCSACSSWPCQSTFDKLGADYPDFEGTFEFLAQLTTVLPALLGVSIGRDPTGAVERILTDLGPLKRARSAVVGAIAVVGGGLPHGPQRHDQQLVAHRRHRPRAAGPQRRHEAGDRRRPPARRAAAAALPDSASADLPLELVGVARPFTVADREMLDAALGVPAERR